MKPTRKTSDLPDDLRSIAGGEDHDRPNAVGKMEHPHNPLINLAKTLQALTYNPFEQTRVMAAVLELPKDEHGNISLGIDDAHFSMWERALKYLVPTQLFYPIVIPTNKAVIDQILNNLKSGDEALFQGNRSTDVVGEFAGYSNAFSPDTAATHSQHKKSFKDHINDFHVNVTKIGPIILNWFTSLNAANADIDGDGVSSLCAQIMVAFLLTPAVAHNNELCQAVIRLKSHFVAKATLHVSNPFSYRSAAQLLKAEISRLYLSGDMDDENYPAILAKAGYSEEAAHSHIHALFMVGFGNLHSALMSLLIRMTEYPEYRDKLEADIEMIESFPFIQFDPVKKAEEFSPGYLQEILRLTPPVWLQARKNRDGIKKIQYKTDTGEKKEYELPSTALVLIPNLQLARNVNENDGDVFRPERVRDSHLPNAFSVGPNACPGRNIAYAALGLVSARLLQDKIKLAFHGDIPRHVPSVSLGWEAKLMFRKASEDTLDTAKATHVSNYTRYGRMWKRPEAINTLSVAIGILATLFLLLTTDNMVVALVGGGVSAILAWHYLSAIANRDMTQYEALRPAFQ